MKLALVIPGPLDRRSGGYSYDVDLVAFLRQEGHGVEVWSLDDVREDPFPSADVVLFDALVHPLVLGLLERGPTDFVKVALVHHLAWQDDPPGHPETELKRDRESRFLSLMDAWMCNSHDTRQAITRLLGPEVYRPSAVFRPPLTAKVTDRDAPGPAPGEPLRMLFLANLLPRKNLHGLLEALTTLRGQRPELVWQLTVVGSPTMDAQYARQCREQCQHAGLDPWVTWKGWTSAEDLEPVWEKTDLLVVPSFHEGWGMVYVEAMARGIPSLVASSGGGAEAVGNTGLLVEPTDPASFVAPLVRWLDDAVWRRELSLRCRQRAAALRAQGTGFHGLLAFLTDLATVRGRARSPLGEPIDVDWAGWLSAKAAIDERSLHPRVMAEAFREPIPHGIWELGGGSGTMAQRLRRKGHVPASTPYRLIDASESAVAEAVRSGTTLFDTGFFRAEVGDLYRVLDHPVGPLPDLVIAHAVADLLDPARAATALAASGVQRFWLTHIFDGLTTFTPEMDEDGPVIAAYHASMDERAHEGHEGSSQSGQRWLTALSRAGLEVTEAAASDWVVMPRRGDYRDDEQAFLGHLLDFFANSLAGRPGLDQQALAWWLQSRRGQLARGELGVIVHQLDLVARRPVTGDRP